MSRFGRSSKSFSRGKSRGGKSGAKPRAKSGRRVPVVDPLKAMLFRGGYRH